MKLKELRERMSQSERWKKLGSDIRLIAKPALITAVIVAGIVGIIFLALFMIREEDVSDFLKRWEQIVESGDDQAYEEICSEEFKEKSGDLYEEIKNLIAEQRIDVSVEDEDIEKIRLGNDRYVIKHIPMFLSKDNINTYEKLDVKQRGLINRRWEIAREERHFSKAASEKLEQIAEGEPAEPFAEPDKAPLDTDFRIRQTLEVWRAAWNNKDMDGYIDCYADYADITRVTVIGGKEKRMKLTKSKLRDHMARLSKKYSRILVDITDLEIEGDVATAKANFLQEYTSWGHSPKGPVYHDLGTKELQFVKHDVEWKITNENWTLYKDVPVYPEREY
jgi:ketosteroid isomerase-like protein